jgi:hypothetical protein
MEIYQQAPPPVPGEEGASPYFPATAFATQSAKRISLADPKAYALYYFQWSNRSTAPVVSAAGKTIQRKSNFQPGWDVALDRRTAFTSVAKANACTLAQTAVIIGRPDQEAAKLLRDAQVQPVRPAAGVQAGIDNATDVCVLPPAALAKAAGVMLDYEVQDGRSTDDTLAFLTKFAELVHRSGKKALLLTNPLDAPTQIYTGVSEANANRIHRLFDRVTLFAWSENRQGDIQASLDHQWEILGAAGPVDPSRVIVNFELAGTSLDDAAVVRRFIRGHHLSGVLFWRNQARQGGSCSTEVNQKIACLAFGACSAPRTAP